MRELELFVSGGEDGLNAAAFLKGHGFSRRMISSLKFSGGIRRDGEVLRGIDPVYNGDMIRVVIEDSGGAEPNPNVQAKIAYEDADAVVFEKPAGSIRTQPVCVSALRTDLPPHCLRATCPKPTMPL